MYICAMIQPWHIWIIAALVFFIIEIFTSGFAVACFTAGALAAAVGAAFSLSLWWQIVLFALFSFFAFVFIRPLILKLFFKEKAEKKTNADALVGKRGKVSSDIDPRTGSGRVAIDGDDWKAVSVDGGFIPKGTAVEVVSIDSIILTVKTLSL